MEYKKLMWVFIGALRIVRLAIEEDPLNLAFIRRKNPYGRSEDTTQIDVYKVLDRAMLQEDTYDPILNEILNDCLTAHKRPLFNISPSTTDDDVIELFEMAKNKVRSMGYEEYIIDLDMVKRVFRLLRTEQFNIEEGNIIPKLLNAVVYSVPMDQADMVYDQCLKLMLFEMGVTPKTSVCLNSQTVQCNIESEEVYTIINHLLE